MEEMERARFIFGPEPVKYSPEFLGKKGAGPWGGKMGKSKINRNNVGKKGYMYSLFRPKTGNTCRQKRNGGSRRGFCVQKEKEIKGSLATLWS